MSETNGLHPAAADLQAFADGEAGSEHVAAHLETCPACRAEVAATRRVTAALSLGSRPPDALLARIQARRSASSAPIVPIASRRERTRARRIVLPLGLAAAAALAIIVPRAMREPADVAPGGPGAKGTPRLDIVLDERIVTETGPTSIDSVSWDISDTTGALRAELRYLAGTPESDRAERLAARIAEQLQAAGLKASSITVISVAAGASPGSPPAGAVAVTMRAGAARAAP
jgi:hypothetical protein